MYENDPDQQDHEKKQEQENSSIACYRAAP